MLGQKLKSLRSRKGITQECMAKVLGVSPQAISKWEQDTTSPDISLLVPIVDFFGVSLDYLLRTDSDPSLVSAENAIEIQVEKYHSYWRCHIKNISTKEIASVKAKALFYNSNNEVVDYCGLYVSALEPGMSYPQLLITSMKECVESVSVIPKECKFACK